MKKSINAWAAFENGGFEINGFGLPVIGLRKEDLYPRQDIRRVRITEIKSKGK